MNIMMPILDLAGTAIFAITGAPAAGRKRMDIFGVVMLGCVTSHSCPEYIASTASGWKRRQNEGRQGDQTST